MTDAAYANGFSSRSASPSRGAQDQPQTAGQGDVERFGASTPPESGDATTWPNWPGVARPAGWFLSVPGEAAPPAGPGTEPARTDLLANAASEQPTMIDQSGAHLAAMERYAAHQRELRERELSQQAPPAPVVGPTAALRGRAGGPGIDSGDLAADTYDIGLRSGWQLADGLWRDSGVRWAQTAVRLERSDVQWEEPAPHVFASAPVMADAPPQDTGTSQTMIDAPVPDLGYVPDFGYPPSDWVRPWDEEEPDQEYAQPAMEALDVPEADPAADWAAAPRRGAAWRVVGVGLPLAVIVTVGAGAFMMLTGKSAGMLVSSASQHLNMGHGPASGNVPSASGSSGNGSAGNKGSAGSKGTLASIGSSGTTGLTPGVFGGYPGQRGTVTVRSLAAAVGTELAAGTADGHPAIWRRDPNGSWTLVSASQPAISMVPGTAGLTGVAHGKAGWIAVGGLTSGTQRNPLIFVSADGVTWHGLANAAFGGAGLSVHAVAASQAGYVVVGQQVSGRRQVAAMWWSPDLAHWTRVVNNGGLDGRMAASDVFGVTATPTGFIAVGSHAVNAAIWTSPTGQSWSTTSFQPPASGTSAVLRAVTATGPRIVTAGTTTTKHGATLPFVFASPDGGHTWRGAMLPAPTGSATVTGLTASTSGFTATGQTGPAGHQVPVKWTSPDGLTWSAPSVIG